MRHSLRRVFALDTDRQLCWSESGETLKLHGSIAALDWPNTWACIISATELQHSPPLYEHRSFALWYALSGIRMYMFRIRDFRSRDGAWRGLARRRGASPLVPTPGGHLTPGLPAPSP